MATKFALSLYLSLAIIALFVALDNSMLHWFLIPALACGVVIGADAVDWMRGRLSLFDPVGILGALGYYFFFLAPLLVVWFKHSLMYLPDQPDDYRPWLGGVSILNFFGLLVYRCVREAFQSPKGDVHDRWQLNNRRFGIALLIAVSISVALQVWVYVAFGGINGYVGAYTAWLQGEDTFKGTGWLFSISESFPILAMIGFAASVHRMHMRRTWMTLFLVMTLFFVVQLIFGGLRGSRANTIWALFWAVGILNFFVKRLPVKVAAMGIPFLLLFMYFYGFYKEAGPGALEMLANSETRAYLTEKTGRNFQVLLLSDFSRSDVQAFLLYRLITTPEAYSYAWGQTYLGALALLVPQSIWESRPAGKVRWTTAAEYGNESYGQSRLVSSRVYGLAGEAMLNFGPLGVPFSFAILGIAVGLVKRLLTTVEHFDSRLMIVPFLVNFCFLILLNDSDVNLFYLVKFGAIPGLLIWFGSDRFPLQMAREEEIGQEERVPV